MSTIQRHSVLDVTDMSLAEIAVALREIANEDIAQSVARMVADGFTLDDLEIEGPRVVFDDGKFRLIAAVTGRRAPAAREDERDG